MNAREVVKMRQDNDELRALVGGALVLVIGSEVLNASQAQWRESWLRQARKHGIELREGIDGENTLQG